MYEVVRPDLMSSFIDSKNAASRRLKQVFGRGLRTPDAECSIILCDPRIDRFTKIAPTKFQKTYFEGMAISVDATKSERSLQLRKDALAHYGETCSTETEA